MCTAAAGRRFKKSLLYIHIGEATLFNLHNYIFIEFIHKQNAERTMTTFELVLQHFFFSFSCMCGKWWWSISTRPLVPSPHLAKLSTCVFLANHQAFTQVIYIKYRLFICVLLSTTITSNASCSNLYLKNKTIVKGVAAYLYDKL